MMVKLDSRSLSLYRGFQRRLRDVCGRDGSMLINLRRSLNPQWRLALVEVHSSQEDTRVALDAIEAKMRSTGSLLEASRKLTRNLSSLSYHHHPRPLRLTANSSRLYSHTDRPIEWDPRDPAKAMKLFEKRKRDGHSEMPDLADAALRRTRDRAEKELGVALGRWETF
ncbi:hypothetical protein JCM3766R1_002066 [Sporobolomyces carnicolor]